MYLFDIGKKAYFFLSSLLVKTLQWRTIVSITNIIYVALFGSEKLQIALLCTLFTIQIQNNALNTIISTRPSRRILQR